MTVRKSYVLGRRKIRPASVEENSDLTVTHNEERLTGDQAQEKIDELLALTAEELGVAVHLRQETIRAFIQGEPSERSKTVDKMIGLFDLRELISGLDLAGVDKEIKQLDIQLNYIDQNMIQATLIARELLTQKEQQLISEGLSKNNLSLDDIKQLFGEINTFLQDLGVKTSQQASISIPASLEFSQIALRQSKTLTAQLQEARIARSQQIIEFIKRFETLLEKLKHSREDLTTLAGIDPKALEEQRDVENGKRSDTQGILNKINAELSSLHRIKIKITETENSLKIGTIRLQELGTIEASEAMISSIVEQTNVVEEAGKSAKALSQLLTIASEFLEKMHPANCPICQKEFENLDLTLITLHQQLSEDPASKKIGALRQEYQSLSI